MPSIFNFNAGPAILPAMVFEEASRGVQNIEGSGLSVLEISHRGAVYERIHAEAKERLVRLLGLRAEDYAVFFLGGGASLQFSMLPMNFLAESDVADYVKGGDWGVKAAREAERFGRVNVAGSSEAEKFARLPTGLRFTAGARYAHVTTNNTIEGSQMSALPDPGGVPLCADVSSDILSMKRDYSRLAFFYAGAQKNLGPAGVTVVVGRKSFLAEAAAPRLSRNIPTMLSYKTHLDGDSLYNTPPVFAIYVLNLVLKWIETEGGVDAIESRNRRKAALVYSALDGHPGAYEPAIKETGDRSLMNVTFRLRDPAREKAFLEGAEKRGLQGLKGHRSVGGFRASIYNAFPERGCAELADYLGEFAK